jgi:hypothetical protein
MSTPPILPSTSAPVPNGCPSPTITPDANGHVPSGTCGYLSRPYYPSLAAALLFTFLAAGVLFKFALRVVRANLKRQQWRRRRHRHRLEAVGSAKAGTTWSGWWWSEGMGPAWTGVVLSAGMVAAYGVRAAGTRWQQVVWFVGISDTVVLVWSVCMCPFLVMLLTSFCYTLLHSRPPFGIVYTFPHTQLNSLHPPRTPSSFN